MKGILIKIIILIIIIKYHNKELHIMEIVMEIVTSIITNGLANAERSPRMVYMH